MYSYLLVWCWITTQCMSCYLIVVDRLCLCKKPKSSNSLCWLLYSPSPLSPLLLPNNDIVRTVYINVSNNNYLYVISHDHCGSLPRSTYYL